MIGNRIRLARQARCLSLRETADKLSELSFPITKGALSNYETGKTPPNENTLPALAALLGVPVDFFYKDDWDDFDITLFAPLNDIAAIHKAELYAHIQIDIERYLDVCDLLNEPPTSQFNTKTAVSAGQIQEIYSVCDHFRNQCGIGQHAIHSVCSILEQQGWILFPLPDFFGPITFSGIEHSRNIRFLFYTQTPHVDDFRITLFQELGRSLLSFPPEQEAFILSCFAREMLLPRALIHYEFGLSRSHILIQELDRVKHAYGISKRNIMLRLKELHVISDTSYNNFLLYLNQNSHIRRESHLYSDLRFREVPSSYAAKVAKAQAEGLITNKPGSVF